MRAAIAVAVLLSGCAGVPRATQSGRLLDLWGQVSDKAFLRVRGIGATRPDARGLTARRGASRGAALVAARYQLLSVIKGVKLEGGITVAQLMEKDSLIREIANEVVSGGDEVKTEWLADDGCVVTLELKRSKVERLINEKSQREIGLEARIARDIEEIKALSTEVAALSQERFDTDDPDVIKWRYDRMSAITRYAEKRSHAKTGGPQIVNDADRQEALESAWALDMLLNTSREDQARWGREARESRKKMWDEIFAETDRRNR